MCPWIRMLIDGVGRLIASFLIALYDCLDCLE